MGKEQQDKTQDNGRLLRSIYNFLRLHSSHFHKVLINHLKYTIHNSKYEQRTITFLRHWQKSQRYHLSWIMISYLILQSFLFSVALTFNPHLISADILYKDYSNDTKLSITTLTEDGLVLILLSFFILCNVPFFVGHSICNCLGLYFVNFKAFFLKYKDLSIGLLRPLKIWFWCYKTLICTWISNLSCWFAQKKGNEKNATKLYQVMLYL